MPQCGGTIALVGAHAWQNTPPQPRQWWRRQNTSNLAPPGARQPGSMQRGACRSGTHAGGWPIGSAGGGSLLSTETPFGKRAARAANAASEQDREDELTAMLMRAMSGAG